MKIKNVVANNHKHQFEIHTYSKRHPVLTFPYGKVEKDAMPTFEDPIEVVYVDPELGNEGFTWILASEVEGSLHIDSVFEENRDPKYMADLLMYKLTVEAQKGVKESPLSKNRIIERLNTSPSQLERLLDQTNTRKSMSQLIALLSVVDRKVEVEVSAM